MKEKEAALIREKKLLEEKLVKETSDLETLKEECTKEAPSHELSEVDQRLGYGRNIIAKVN